MFRASLCSRLPKGGAVCHSLPISKWPLRSPQTGEHGLFTHKCTVLQYEWDPASIAILWHQLLLYAEAVSADQAKQLYRYPRGHRDCTRYRNMACPWPSREMLPAICTSIYPGNWLGWRWNYWNTLVNHERYIDIRPHHDHAAPPRDSGLSNERL